MSQSKKHICVLVADVVYSLPGGMMFLLSESSADLTVKIYRNNRKVKSAVDISDVWKYKAKSLFDSVTLLSATNQTVEVFIDDEGDVTVNKIGGNVNADSVIPTVFDSQADISINADTTTLVLAANADRSEAIVSNLEGNETIRVGGSDCAADNGVPIAGGATFTIDTTAALYVYNPAAGAQIVAPNEITK